MFFVFYCCALERLKKNAGIAIGPILFIIAILGLFAVAIASGNGLFSAKAGDEGRRTKAAALIEIGQTLKVGMDRVMSLDDTLHAADIVIDPANTTASNHLFSPQGGGVGAPATTMAMLPSTDVWYYPMIIIPNLGTTSVTSDNPGSRVAFIEVAPDVCDEINFKIDAINKTDTPGETAGGAKAVGNIADPDSITTPLDVTAADHSQWLAALVGKPLGCVQISTDLSGSGGPGPNAYYFYQVLYSQ